MSISFDPQARLIIILVKLRGPRDDTVVRLALDTGATTTLISRNRLALIGYDPAAASETVRITTGSGVEFVPIMTLERIEALEQQHEGFAVLGHTLPPSAGIDGVLGLDFLRGRRLVIDFGVGLLSLE